MISRRFCGLRQKLSSLRQKKLCIFFLETKAKFVHEEVKLKCFHEIKLFFRVLGNIQEKNYRFVKNCKSLVD